VFCYLAKAITFLKSFSLAASRACEFVLNKDWFILTKPPLFLSLREFIIVSIIIDRKMASHFNLYHLTLQPPTAITHACSGNFSGANNHEFVVARGGFLEVLRRDASYRLRTLYREQAFGSIRTVAAVRLSGQNRDLIVLTSDSGRLSFLKFTGTAFETLYCETYGKSGVRRVVPGEYLATDPAGRAVMIGAVEKEKFVFAINRDSEDQLYVSSPLEAHKSNSITFTMVGLDVGFDNPLFAALETVYDDPEEGKKLLVFYEVDLGLNHVVRKWSRTVSDSANHLIAVPSGGVVVCSADSLEYIKPNVESLRVHLPRREWDAAEREALIISSASLQTKGVFFSLLQTERGDLFKLSVGNGKASAISVKYFDSVAPANQICISRDGNLFVASEFGNHELYQFKSTGDSPDDTSVEVSSKDAQGSVSFLPRDIPLNLELLDSQKSLAPIVSMKVADIAKDSGVNQIYALCGRAEKSSLRTLRQGVPVSEVGVLRFPATKTDTNRGIWTVRGGEGADRFIIVSLKDSTKVFEVRAEPVEGSDETRDVIEEKTSELFEHGVFTIAAGSWGTRGTELVQVTPGGWRRLDFATGKVVSQYKCPGQKRVDVACVNNRQICLGLANGEIVYFEADGSGAPAERARYDIGVDIACMDCDVSFLALGCWDSSIRVLSLDKMNLMSPLSSQKVPSKPSSLGLIRDEARNQVRMDIGLQNGLLVRSVLDIGSSGAIVDTRSHVLGNKAVKVQKVLLNVDESGTPEAVSMCCSTRVWLARAQGIPLPLSFRAFEYIAPFRGSSFGGNEGMVALGPGNAVTICFLDGFGLDTSRRFNEEVHKLDRTPRRLVRHPTRADLIVTIEGDRDSFLSKVTVSAKGGSSASAAKETRGADDMDVDEDDGDVGFSTAADGVKDKDADRGRVVGHARQQDPDASWASCIRVLHPLTGQTLQRIQLEPNEMAVSIEQGKFASSTGGEEYLFVGTVTGMKFHPRSQGSCAVRTYKFLPSGGKLELVHVTKVEDVPLALVMFDGRLLCGAGSSLTLYDMGHKQLLRKCELKGLPSQVTFLRAVSSERVVVGDLHESVYFVFYSKQENSFSIFADDVMSRMCVAGDVVDPNTCAASDKFGSVFVVRLPAGATGTDPKSRAAHNRTALWDQGNLGGAPHKLELLAHFYVGDVVTSLQKCQLAPGRTETLLYGTMLGSIGSFSPFASRDDLDFFSHLEIHMRKYHRNILGRDHLQYRSYYTPVKSVIDGDLCEAYFRLPDEIKSKIAKEMDRSVDDVCRRLEEMRANVLW